MFAPSSMEKLAGMGDKEGFPVPAPPVDISILTP